MLGIFLKKSEILTSKRRYSHFFPLDDWKQKLSDIFTIILMQDSLKVNHPSIPWLENPGNFSTAQLNILFQVYKLSIASSALVLWSLGTKKYPEYIVLG